MNVDWIDSVDLARSQALFPLCCARSQALFLLFCSEINFAVAFHISEKLFEALLEALDKSHRDLVSSAASTGLLNFRLFPSIYMYSFHTLLVDFMHINALVHVCLSSYLCC